MSDPIEPSTAELPDVETLAAVHAHLESWRPWFSGAPPLFSPGWFALADDDPARHAALVLWAFARWAEEMDLGGPPRRVMVESSHQIAAAFRDHNVRFVPCHADVAARRPTAAPRPGDYLGGTVEWGSAT